MKHKRFLWYWLAFLACCSTVVGAMALLEIANAEIRFWNQQAIETNTGKSIWIIVSALLGILFWKLAAKDSK